MWVSCGILLQPTCPVDQHTLVCFASTSFPVRALCSWPTWVSRWVLFTFAAASSPLHCSSSFLQPLSYTRMIKQYYIKWFTGTLAHLLGSLLSVLFELVDLSDQHVSHRICSHPIHGTSQRLSQSGTGRVKLNEWEQKFLLHSSKDKPCVSSPSQ